MSRRHKFYFWVKNKYTLQTLLLDEHQTTEQPTSLCDVNYIMCMSSVTYISMQHFECDRRRHRECHHVCDDRCSWLLDGLRAAVWMIKVGRKAKSCVQQRTVVHSSNAACVVSRGQPDFKKLMTAARTSWTSSRTIDKLLTSMEHVHRVRISRKLMKLRTLIYAGTVAPKTTCDVYTRSQRSSNGASFSHCLSVF